MLEELQSMSDRNKKRVLIIATVIIMIIIIGVWVAYFNSVIMGTTQPAATEATTSSAVGAPTQTPTTTAATATAPVTAQANGPSLWQNIKDWFGSIANVFKKPSEYTIQPQSN
jgi:flagellar basal body-associated protein FliL